MEKFAREFEGLSTQTADRKSCFLVKKEKKEGEEEKRWGRIVGYFLGWEGGVAKGGKGWEEKGGTVDI